jgi:uncharacterized protein YrrD
LIVDFKKERTMLRTLKELIGYKIQAVDEELGSVRDLLFDDETWGVRYLVAATGPWLFGKRVLLSWMSLGPPNWGTKRIQVNLTKEQIKRAPGIDADAPVSRRQELELSKFYDINPYWLASITDEQSLESTNVAIEETHLRSFRQVKGYRIRASDGELGHVEDLISDDDQWFIRYEASPEYDPSKPVARDYERELHDFYGKSHYWII